MVECDNICQSLLFKLKKCQKTHYAWYRTYYNVIICHAFTFKEKDVMLCVLIRLLYLIKKYIYFSYILIKKCLIIFGSHGFIQINEPHVVITN